MGLRFFADHCISNHVIQLLRDADHDVFRLKDCIPPESPDSIVISEAQHLDAILVSLNGDFADIVAYPPENYRGIVSLQVRNHPEVTSRIMTRLMDYLEAHPDVEHYRGKLLVIEPHRIRIRQ